jgi:hypothetical protein
MEKKVCSRRAAAYRKQLLVVRFINFRNYPRDIKGRRDARAPPLLCGPRHRARATEQTLVICLIAHFLKQ